MRLLKKIVEYWNFFTGSRHLCRKINDLIEINHKRIRHVMDMKTKLPQAKFHAFNNGSSPQHNKEVATHNAILSMDVWYLMFKMDISDAVHPSSATTSCRLFTSALISVMFWKCLAQQAVAFTSNSGFILTSELVSMMPLWKASFARFKHFPRSIMCVKASEMDTSMEN